jgi:uncharacterized damage-inducible protein DinB
MTQNPSITIARLARFWSEEVKPPIGKALELAPDDKLDWAPAENMITLGNIFLHVGETSLGWIGALIDGGEFTSLQPRKSPPKSEIESVLDQHWERLEGFFGRAPQILGETYDLRPHGHDAEVTGEWIFLHLFEHDIHHRSQINHYLRILGIKPPRI